jgi:hypothetical protein
MGGRVSQSLYGRTGSLDQIFGFGQTSLANLNVVVDRPFIVHYVS